MASKHRRNKTKFKWNAPLIALIVIVVVMIGAAIGLSLPTQAEKNLSKYNDAITAYNTENSASYTTLQDTKIVYKQVGYDTLSKKMNDGFVIVLYGTLKDGNILANLYDINEKCKKLDVKTVYILSSEWYSEDDEDDVDFKKEVKERQNTLSGKKSSELNNLDVDDIDLSQSSAIWCYADGAILFNSQQYSGGTWDVFKANVFSKAQAYKLSK